MMERFNEEQSEETPPPKKEKRKASDFLTEDDTLHGAKLQILTGLQTKNVYRGTVDGETRRRRRATNKRARAARRKNR